MVKSERYIDIIYLSIFSLSIILSIYYHFAEGYVLSVNNYIAILLLVFVFILRVTKPDRIVYGVISLLLLSTFDIINFSVFVINAPVYHISDYLIINGFGFNIVVFFTLIIYAVTNRTVVSQLIKKIFRKTEEEQFEKSIKMTNFYYKKFSLLDSNDFHQVLINIKEYPVEAQNALRKIEIERSI